MKDAQLPIIIGREKELFLIKNLIVDGDARNTLCIHGPGGIGKTKLLQQAYEIYRIGDNLLLPPIFDFDDPFLFVMQSAEEEIAARLDKDRQYFSTYFEELDKRRRMELSEVSREELELQISDVRETFLNCYHNLASQKRIVLLLDTVEKLQEDRERWDHLVQLIPTLRNTLVILAGRRGLEVWDTLARVLGEEHIAFVELEGFTLEQANQYLDQWPIGKWIEPDLREKIHFLSKGRPILIDLAIDWLSHDLPLPELVKMSLQEIKSLESDRLEQLREQFEEALVRVILSLTEPIYLAVLDMAYVYRRFDVEILSYLLSLSSEEATQMIEELSGLSFVKSRPGGIYILHDEMRRMVYEYVWPKYDPFVMQRQRLSQAMSRYYDPRLAEVRAQIESAHRERINAIKEKDPIREQKAYEEIERLGKQCTILEAEHLFHTLRADPQKGADAFVEAFEWAREYKADALGLLVREIEDFEKDHFELDQYEVSIRKAEYLIEKMGLDEAHWILDELMQRYADGGEREVDLLTRLAYYAVRSGHMPEAADYLTRALNICQEQDLDERVGIVKNELGTVNQLMGRWDRAILYYENALSHTRAESKVAEILDNLGYVHGLRGDWAGVTICQDALDRRRKLGLPRSIGISHNTLGTVYWNLDNSDKALQNHEEALRYFRLSGDSELMAQAHLGKGRAYWAKEMPDKAKESLEEGLKIGRRRYPVALNALGYVYLDLGNSETALEYLEAGHHEAQRIFDTYDRADSLAGLAELNYHRGQRDKIAAYARDMDELERAGYEYPIFFGRMRRVLGDVAFDEKRYDEALEHYSEALCLVAQHGGYGKYAFRNELAQLIERTETLPAGRALEWYEKLIEFWRKSGMDWQRPELIFLCKTRRAEIEAKLS